VTKIIPPAIANLVTPEAGAKHEVLFNKQGFESSVYKEFLME
jgi:hypothetical protein